MISLNNVSIKYHNEDILNNINIHISKPGLYVIVGPSGSGKSTLLNILGLMEDKFEGEYIFFDEDVKKMSLKKKSLIRFNQMSFIFQTPRLIDNESIMTNIELITKVNDEEKIKKVFEKLNLKVKLNQKISTLSGGELQRVNLAMALIKDTPLILADEITSGLDYENKLLVFKILKELSASKIIIMVTHDVDLLNEYKIPYIELINHTLPRIEKNGTISKKEEKVKNDLSYKYLIRHVHNIISKKRIRTLICSFSSMVALVCLGFCLILTNSFSESIMNSFSKMIDETKIVMKKKNESNMTSSSLSIDKEEIELIYDNYYQYSSYMGCKYMTNLLDFFKDDNRFLLKVNNINTQLKGYSISSINDFKYIADEENYIYSNTLELDNDDVILNLPLTKVYSLCSLLNIECDSESSLYDNYLKYHKLPISIYIANESWQYDLEIKLFLVGYNVCSTPLIYHSNPYWNEYVIETIMQLPYSYDLQKEDYYPWTTKKINYIAVRKEDIYNFLNKYLLDKSMELFTYYIDELDDEYYYLYFFYNYNKNLHVYDIDNILKDNNKLSSYIPMSSTGYNIVESVLMNGFAYPTYLSNNYELIEEFIDLNSFSDQNLESYQGTTFQVNENMLSLGLLDCQKDSFVGLKSYDKNNLNLVGNYPKNQNEMIVSTGLLNKLNLPLNIDELLNKQLYFLMLDNITKSNGQYENHFKIVQVSIVGYVENEEPYFYIEPSWPIIFLSSNLLKSSDSYCIDNVLFEYNGLDIENDLDELNSKYKEYTFSNPYLDYKTKIDETIYYINLGLSIFSGFCLLASFLMIVMSSYIFVRDNKKEIGIYTCLGYSSKSIKNQFDFFSLYLCIYSGSLSLIALLTIIFLMNKGMLGINVSFSLTSYFPLIIVFCIALIMGLLSSYLSTFKTLKESPLKQLQS
jgi:putative ABC transport system ATP-binding protein